MSKNTSDIIVANNRQTKLFILLPCQICSLICSLFIMFNIFLRPAKFIKPVANHFIIVLLFSSFIQVSTELSMVENYLHIGIVRPSINVYCLFFNWFEFSLNGISLFVMFWASIERHILIFSKTSYQIRWKRICFHHIPFILFIIYKPICYGYLIFLYDCVNNWDYYELLCTAPCFYQTKSIGIFDWLFNIIIPVFSIAIANLTLIIRVTYCSHRLSNNPNRRKKNRTMTIQLLLVSWLFLVFWLPIAVTGLIQQFFYSTFLIDIQFNIFFYLIYFIQLCLPFVCLFSLPHFISFVNEKYRQFKHRNMIFIATRLR